MADNLYNTIYNPDVLSCIANLSNDEVFTPPVIANKMLDLLPQKLFNDPKTTFLDPACKSGVFLREIAKRLLKGLETQIPDLQERANHIFKKQLYGISITELTSHLARRSVYCSKTANGTYSVVDFDTVDGNIRFKPIEHTWVNGKCKFCGASKEKYARGSELESYAYEFIHVVKPEEIFDMKFDVIVGNPPYQMAFGLDGGNSSNAKSIYNLFIDAAIRLDPRLIVMIVPSRWMTKTAQGISESWIDEMLCSNHISVMHDFLDSKSIFPGVDIKGGVNYFLWERGYYGRCNYNLHTGNAVDKRIDFLNTRNSGVLIRDPLAISIIDKIVAHEGDYYLDANGNMSGLVSAKHFFDNSIVLTSNWTGYTNKKDKAHTVKYYANIERERTYRWISKTDIPKNSTTKDLHKVYIPAAGGSGNDDQVLGRPFYGEPNSVCSQTYLVIGYDPVHHHFSKNECMNIITYIKTRFFRYLVSIKKKTQNGPRGVYQFVPLQDFSKPWTDAELYKKYKLTKEEIAFIESMIKLME